MRYIVFAAAFTTVNLHNTALAESATWVCTEVEHESCEKFCKSIPVTHPQKYTFLVDAPTGTVSINGREVARGGNFPKMLRWHENSNPFISDHLLNLDKQTYSVTRKFYGQWDTLKAKCDVPVVSVVRP